MAAGTATTSAEALALLASHQEHASTLKASKARDQFLPLLQMVVRDPTAVVFVEHRDLPARGMLVGEQYQQYVRQLEQTVRALLAPPQWTTFRLAGSVTLVTDDVEDALDGLRTEQARRTEAKLETS